MPIPSDTGEFINEYGSHRIDCGNKESTSQLRHAGLSVNVASRLTIVTVRQRAETIRQRDASAMVQHTSVFAAKERNRRKGENKRPSPNIDL